MNQSKVVINVERLRKSYGKHTAVKDISFRVSAGSCVGLLGPNGAGKTTVLNACLGLVNSDSGNVQMLGLDMPAEGLKVRKRIGVVPQTNMLDPDFNCVENLQIYARYFGMEKGEAEERIPHLLEFTGLQERSREPITNLSGGMQRRLTLGRALINDPELILLDEPTTGLDPQARHLIWERLGELKQDNKALLLVTHFMEEAQRLCDYIYIIDHGEVIAEGSPESLIAAHSGAKVLEDVFMQLTGRGLRE